jgi:hypothetical protein
MRAEWGTDTRGASGLGCNRESLFLEGSKQTVFSHPDGSEADSAAARAKRGPNLDLAVCNRAGAAAVGRGAHIRAVGCAAGRARDEASTLHAVPAVSRTCPAFLRYSGVASLSFCRGI